MKRTLLYAFIFTFIFGCGSKRNIIYFQNTDNDQLKTYPYVNYKLKIDDVLKIDFLVNDPLEMNTSMRSGTNTPNQSKENLLYSGYSIGFDGNINFPMIGLIKAEGLTIAELRELIKKKTNEKKLFNNPYIEVKLINSHFYILGEVKSPGRYEYFENNLNLVEAIGMAGDLTINGKRDDIKLLRKIGDEDMFYEFDLTSSNILSNPNFQIFSGDVIIVNPNITKVKNSGIIGNSGTLLSLLSFLLSSFIVLGSN